MDGLILLRNRRQNFLVLLQRACEVPRVEHLVGLLEDALGFDQDLVAAV